jgi:hypothetical protein
MRLKDLIPKSILKEDDIVKNKKTGNVYVVKQMDPAKHDKPTPAEVDKTKATNGGQLPKGETPSKPTPQQPQQQKPQGQKLSAGDFKSSAEKGSSGGKTPSKNVLKTKTNRDIQRDKLSKEKEAIDKEWNEKYTNLSDAEFEKYDMPLQQKSDAIQKQIDDLEPSILAFGEKTQKAVTDWFDKNKIPYELKAGSPGNTPRLQFDSKDLPKDKDEELIQLARRVQKEDGIGIKGDLDSTLYIK